MGGPLSLTPQKEENVITEALIRQCIQVVLRCYLPLLCISLS